MLEGISINRFRAVANDLNAYTLAVQLGVQELRKIKGGSGERPRRKKEVMDIPRAQTNCDKHPRATTNENSPGEMDGYVRTHLGRHRR